MDIIRHIEKNHGSFHRPVLSLGNFDGVHLGHQAILTRLVSEAQRTSSEAVVLTFYPHPLSVLMPERFPPLLLTVRKKLELIRATGVDKLILQRFTWDFSRHGPEDFVHRYLVESIGIVKAIVGHNVNFGRGRMGNAVVLQELGKRWGFDVEVVGPVKVEGAEVSSTAIRSFIAAGEMGRVRRLLGRYYAITGRVEKGWQRGKRLGFPTANLCIRSAVLLPPDGVYAVLTDVTDGSGVYLKGVANIGKRPTFGEEHRTVEVHLFDFSEDLYGSRLGVQFVERLRGEIAFPSPQALAGQVEKDAARAREILAHLS